jgi:NAD(P)-dependent dehydrogenase (short-subunit alcohol dehydrogenase family)/acyl carrier protein
VRGETRAPSNSAAFERGLLEVVADKTGYPLEMLNLDMQLDADLGIDSIKRVEILSAMQEKFPDAPQVQSDHLGSLKTLREIVAYMSQVGSAHESGNGNGNGHSEPCATGSLSTRVEAHGQATNTASTPPKSVGGPQAVAHINPEATLDRFVLSAEHLEPAESKSAAIIPAAAEIWIAAEDDCPLAQSLRERFEEHGYRPRLIDLLDTLNGTDEAEVPSVLGALIFVAPARVASPEQADTLVKAAFQWMKLCGSALRAGTLSGGAVLAAITRLDGASGLSWMGPAGALELAGWSGLVKTARHEWPGVAVKAIDLDPSWASYDSNEGGDPAETLLEEIVHEGPVEIGLKPGSRSTLHLTQEAMLPVAQAPAPLLAKGDVIVVSGGARGVTAEAAIALARTYQATLVLLGRSAAPQSEESWLSTLKTEAEIKRALLARANGSANPKALEEEYKKRMANREVLRTLDLIAQAGGKGVYRSVDVQNAAALSDCLKQIRGEFGAIKGLVHGAGVLADRLIEDKTDAQFESVYKVKVEGLRALLAATQNDELKFMALFSSITGREGRRGQCDYAAANEVLNKIAQAEARRRADARVVSFNWGPWDGGMVTPALRKVFESENIGLIPPQDGGEFLVRELQRENSDAVEVLVLGKAPVKGGAPRFEAASPRPSGERVETKSGVRGETLPNSVPAATPPLSATPAFEIEVDLERFPILRAHVLNGKVVVPMALIMEWLAQGAMHSHPGLSFSGFDDLRLLKGIVLENEEPYTVRVYAGTATRPNGHFEAPVEVRGVDASGRDRVHARAMAILVSRPSLENIPEISGGVNGLVQSLNLTPFEGSREELYPQYLFHGPALQCIENVEGCSDAGISAVVKTAPEPTEWIVQPLRSQWAADPLVMDGAFQLLILWSWVKHDAPSLPNGAKRYRQYVRNFPLDQVRIVARITKDKSAQAFAEVSFFDTHGKLLAQLEDYECVIDASLSKAFQLNQLA